MAIDPPYRFDPFQNLVAVHWPEETTSTGGIGEIWPSFAIGVTLGGNSIQAGGPNNGLYPPSIYGGGTISGSPYQSHFFYEGGGPFTIDVIVSGLVVTYRVYNAGGGLCYSNSFDLSTVVWTNVHDEIFVADYTFDILTDHYWGMGGLLQMKPQ